MPSASTSTPPTSAATIFMDSSSTSFLSGGVLNQASAASGVTLTGTVNNLGTGDVWLHLYTNAAGSGGDWYKASVSGTTWSITLPPSVLTHLADGDTYLSVGAYYAPDKLRAIGAHQVLENSATPSAAIVGGGAYHLVVDLTPPAAVSVGLQLDSGSSNTDHITNNGALVLNNVEAGATVQYSIDGGHTWTSSFSAQEGLNSLLVRQIDVHANVGPSTSFSFTLDTQVAAPSVALTTDSGASDSDHVTNVGTLAVGGTEAGALVEYSTDGGASWSQSFSAAEGANSVLVRQTDLAGNVSDPTALSFTLDTQVAAPSVALTTDSGASDSDHFTNIGTLAVGGTESGAVVEYSTDGGASWSQSFSAAEGANTVLVRQTDLAGNVSDGAAFDFTLDTAAPTTTTVLSPNGVNTTITEVISGVADGTGSEAVSVQIYDGQTLLGAVTPDSNGSWSYTAHGLAPGAHSFTEVVTDAAGNVSAQIIGGSVTVDLGPGVWMTGETHSDGNSQNTKYYFAFNPNYPTATTAHWWITDGANHTVDSGYTNLDGQNFFNGKYLPGDAMHIELTNDARVALSAATTWWIV
jgi:hypothetical protein